MSTRFLIPSVTSPFGSHSSFPCPPKQLSSYSIYHYYLQVAQYTPTTFSSNPPANPLFPWSVSLGSWSPIIFPYLLLKSRVLISVTSSRYAELIQLFDYGTRRVLLTFILLLFCTVLAMSRAVFSSRPLRFYGVRLFCVTRRFVLAFIRFLFEVISHLFYIYRLVSQKISTNFYNPRFFTLLFSTKSNSHS